MTTDAGEIIDYGLDSDTPMMHKLYDAVQCVKEGGAPLCGPRAGLSHLLAVRMAQGLPVRNIDPSHVAWLEEDNDQLPCVRGLEETFLASAEKWALPGEMGLSL